MMNLNDQASTDSGIEAEDNTNNDTDHEWPPPPPSEVGQDGLVSILGQVKVIGGTPTLFNCGDTTSNDPDAELLEGSTDTVGMILINHNDPVDTCGLRFSEPVPGFPICVTSSLIDPVVVFAWLPFNEAVIFGRPLGADFSPGENIRYICFTIDYPL